MASDASTSIEPAAPLRVLARLSNTVRRLCRARLQRPADVHDLRVAIRRLRAGLSVLRDTIGRDRRRELDAELHRLQRSLGPVREWDVLRGDLAHAARRQPEAAELRTRLRRRRDHALRKVQRRLSGRRAERLHKHLRKLRLRLLGAATSVTPARQASALRALAREALGRRLGIVESLAATLDVDDPEATHRLRVQIKKLRYTAELFAPMFPAPRTQAFLRVLKQVQDELGHAHDALVERDQLADLRRRDRASAEALLRMRERCDPGAQGAGTRAGLQTLAQLRAFWRPPPRASRSL